MANGYFKSLSVVINWKCRLGLNPKAKKAQYFFEIISD